MSRPKPPPEKTLVHKTRERWREKETLMRDAAEQIVEDSPVLAHFVAIQTAWTPERLATLPPEAAADIPWLVDTLGAAIRLQLEVLAITNDVNVLLERLEMATADTAVLAGALLGVPAEDAGGSETDADVDPPSP